MPSFFMTGVFMAKESDIKVGLLCGMTNKKKEKVISKINSDVIEERDGKKFVVCESMTVNGTPPKLKGVVHLLPLKKILILMDGVGEI